MKIRFRKRNKNDDNKQLGSIGDHMSFANETTMEKGLLIQPTTATATATLPSSLSSSAASNNIVVDCLKFVPTSWPLTGRRGRKGTSSTTSSTTTTDDVIASDQRLHTKSSTTTSAATTVDDVIASDDQLKTKRVKIETHSDHERLLKKKVHSNEKKNGVLEKEYKCDVCSKVFTNPRALGGHKSSHYKPNKTYDTPIKKEATTSKPKITMSLDLPTDQTNQKRVMDFDLNNRLPLDDEETIPECCLLRL